jgi:hypothetical protein
MFFTWCGFFALTQRQASHRLCSGARDEAQGGVSAIFKLHFFQKNLDDKNKTCTFAPIVD